MGIPHMFLLEIEAEGIDLVHDLFARSGKRLSGVTGVHTTSGDEILHDREEVPLDYVMDELGCNLLDLKGCPVVTLLGKLVYLDGSIRHEVVRRSDKAIGASLLGMLRQLNGFLCPDIANVHKSPFFSRIS